MGYDFRSDHWHHGYATEAATAVRDYALRDLGLSHVISLIRVTNEPSRRVAERIGMYCVGESERFGVRYWQYALIPDEGKSYD